MDTEFPEISKTTLVDFRPGYQPYILSFMHADMNITQLIYIELPCSWNLIADLW